MAIKRTAEEIQRLLEGYRQRSVTRAEYCRQQGISANTLAYHLRHHARRARPRMARVKLTPANTSVGGRFSLVLVNGRRIESGWGFRDAELARLIRVAESA